MSNGKPEHACKDAPQSGHRPPALGTVAFAAHASGTPARRLSLCAAEERIGIARALIGATRAELAAHLGAASRPAVLSDAADNAARPTHSLADLARAFHAVIAWYREDEVTGLAASPLLGAAAGTASGLDGLVRQYLTLRSAHDGLSAASIRAATGAALPSRQAAQARRRAMLIDDCSDVLVTVSAFLEAFGLDVLTIADADAVLALLATETPVHLLVTDHAMPGMTGRDLAAEAVRMRPDLRTLIITGYPDLAELDRLPPGVSLLAKPFRRAELDARITALFAETPAMPVTSPGG